jgi:hypothetical protein
MARTMPRRISDANDKSGMSCTMLTPAVLLLFAGFGSLDSDVTVAVFVVEPSVLPAFAVIVIVTLPPLRIDPTEQVTVVVPVHVPCVVVADTNVIVGGSVSVTVTVLAVSGPPFVTTIV